MCGLDARLGLCGQFCGFRLGGRIGFGCSGRLIFECGLSCVRRSGGGKGLLSHRC